MAGCLEPGEYMGKMVAKRRFGDFLLTEAVFSPNTVLPKHTHEAATICIVLHGGFRERSRHGDVTAEPGLVLYRPQGHHHSDEFVNANGRTFGLDLADDPDRLPSEQIPMNSPTAARLSAELYREFRRDDDCSCAGVHQLVLLLREEIGRIPARQRTSAPGWLASVRERIAAEYQQSPSLTDLAYGAGVHPVHLSRQFQRFSGFSIAQSVRYFRVQHARRRLNDKTMSIGEAGIDAGFCDQAHFSRAFREFIGMTPGEYQRRNRLSV
jgi:AraC family transcriptional regulator